MRIVAGAFRGRPLVAPKGHLTRPTADRARQAIFNILAHGHGDPITGARVLDLFAGTGALGLEAMSRGARFALFIDDGAEARALMRQAQAAVDERYRIVLRRDIPSWRAIQLQQMRERENPLWVALRESNTLTAHSYRRGIRDSFFLFFTEDAGLLRPVGFKPP